MGGGKLMRIAATLFYGFDVVRSVILYCRGDRTVIFVRYTMACAYLPRPTIKPVYWLVSRILPRSPDMFFLDVEPAEALRRVRERGDTLEMFETLPRMEKARSRAMIIRGRLEGRGRERDAGRGVPAHVRDIIGQLQASVVISLMDAWQAWPNLIESSFIKF